MSDPSAGKALVQRFVEEGVNHGRLDVIYKVLAPTHPALALGRDGRDQVKALLVLWYGRQSGSEWRMVR